ncbi:membrane-bound PQQ-dependent dehydrogenase, glucose/quinate/shikimate family [Verticiella sediminum]|uniref:Membrane-bound PQQ-dependent dehydrogenase, glucose/quinate/shikimate family n=1 Tax=Verticiella sediminum TaxID=1247510 RepID=A0A556A7G4_9BURK|nr:membrane-bound PQQ-dependent dehydrogenase, glucose/quinate/shikimate family [Verticiella sediminum]TSH88824.1 membrane-bound PQQ-dependent dehydrogenase, glucose/quinate/shikimate family [Verticiella sediminum]
MPFQAEPADRQVSAALRLYTTLLALVLGLVGLYFVYNGTKLIMLGGSLYYLPAGIALIATAMLLVRLSLRAAYLYLGFFVVTALWSFWEAGFQFWPLAARLGLFAVLGLLLALCVPCLPGAKSIPRIRGLAFGLAGATAVGLVTTFVGAFSPVWLVRNGATPQVAADYKPELEPKDWVGFGRTTTGEQFSPDTQITKDNVGQLQVAWTLRTGDISADGRENQNTPLQIGNTLYPCTQSGQVFAVRGDTGEKLWHFDPEVTPASTANWMRCRSLAYFEVPELSNDTPGKKRVYLTTGDMRLIALDAATGKPVPSFGEDGTVYLAEGMGKVIPGFYNPTSGPLLAGRNLIVGGWVMDNQSTDEPSGVVRAFNAVTGELTWAWDVGRPGKTGKPAEGEVYTRGTPNMWATPSYDAELNMVYLPTGGATPDLFGGLRSPESERVSQSVVALDATTGQERWVYQLVHHDVWDYDLPSKPVLYDMPDGKGGRVPALVQAGKNGEIFVLDRRTGMPLTRVEERPVPTQGVPGERLSPTQPYSVGMPQMRDTVLTEAKMWGITPIDQLSCRVQFKGLHYEGDYTPPQLEWYLENPSWYGTNNWGGQSMDKQHDIMIVNDMRIMMKGRLLSREETNERLANKSVQGVGGVIPMANTPYGAERGMVQSFLGVPCTTPPFGTMAAIDMNTHRVIWHRSLGTPEQFGPLGMKTHLPIELGMPTLGGAVATGSGLVFFSATSDYYLRAIDVMTGEVVWKSPLPVGGGSTPLVFTSPADGRQYVVVTASGSRAAPDYGDYLIAYALPEQARP